MTECSCVGHCRGRDGLSERYLCVVEQRKGKVPFTNGDAARRLDVLEAEASDQAREIVAQVRANVALTEALKQARREYGAFGSLSGETLRQMDDAIAKAEGR